MAVPEGRGTTGCTENVASAAPCGTLQAAGHRDGFAHHSSSRLPSCPGRATGAAVRAPLSSLPAGAGANGHCFPLLASPAAFPFLAPTLTALACSRIELMAPSRAGSGPPRHPPAALNSPWDEQQPLPHNRVRSIFSLFSLPLPSGQMPARCPRPPAHTMQ